MDDLITTAAEALAKLTRLEPGPIATVNESPADLVPSGTIVHDPDDTNSGMRRRGPGAALREDQPVA